MHYRCLPPDRMLHRAKRSSKFFHLAHSPNEQTKLRDIGNNTHAMPVNNKSIEERIMEMLPDAEEDSTILSDQGTNTYISKRRKDLDTDNSTRNGRS